LTTNNIFNYFIFFYFILFYFIYIILNTIYKFLKFTLLASDSVIDESLSNILKLGRLDIPNLEAYYKHIINMFEIRKLHQQVINFTKYAVGLYSDKRILTVEVYNFD